jgi:hypothetical protein
MSDSTQPTDPSTQSDGVRTRNRNADPTANAVARCHTEWKAIYDAILREFSDRMDDLATSVTVKLRARKEAKTAYYNAMPPLSSRENIQGYIACVAHGVLVGAISESACSKLLYAAQVAISALPREPKPSGRPQK